MQMRMGTRMTRISADEHGFISIASCRDARRASECAEEYYLDAHRASLH